MVKSDFEPDLSPDLEWLLQSGQAGDRTLVPILVKEHYTSLYRLASTILGDPEMARQAACTTIATAVITAHRYPGKISAQVWLIKLTLQTCNRRLPRHSIPSLQLLLFLRAEFNLNPFEIAQALDILATAVQAELGKVQLVDPASLQPGQAPTSLTSTIPAQIPGLPPGGFDQLQSEILLQVDRWRRRKRLATRLQEISLIGLGILLVTMLVIIAAASIPSPPAVPRPSHSVLAAQAIQAGQPVVIPLGTPQLSLITPTPVTPVPPLESLSLTSSAAAIRQRILESHQRWHTLWADALFINYGPPGYVGPPKVARQQVWISQPDHSLSLSGELSGEVEWVYLSDLGRISALNYLTGERQRYGRNLLVDYNLPLQEMILPTRMRTTFEGLLQIRGLQTVAGRETLAVDWFEIDPSTNGTDGLPVGNPLNQGRFWVDTRTGVILRRQWFDRKNPDLITKEVLITDIAFDVAISNRLFDPFQPFPTRLARDVRGDPLPFDTASVTSNWQLGPGRKILPRLAPPPGFDPSQDSLSFQWTNLADFDPAHPTQADVFAGGFYLGGLAFGHPSRLSCDRSPDGQLIAFTEWQQGPPFGATSLHWFSLADFGTVHEPMPEVISGDFAFAPQGHRLALFACTRDLAGCGLYSLDIISGQDNLLLEMAYAGSLTWNPDGQELAFLGALKPREKTSLWVVRATDGQVIYTGLIDEESHLPAPDSPTYAWGVPFPARSSGLDDCTTPPG